MAENFFWTREKVDGTEILHQNRIFALNGKEKAETVTFSSGGNLKRISKVKLGKDNLKIETRVIIPGGNFITGNREFTLVEKANAMLVKISIRGRLYSPPNQKLYYNKRK
jgi:hypothetical protein